VWADYTWAEFKREEVRYGGEGREADREKCSFSPLHPAFFSLFLSTT